MTNWLHPIELEGKIARLVPLNNSHREGLLQAASDGKLWELWYTSVPSEKTINDYIAYALKEQTNGKALPFVVVDNKTNSLIGSTRYCNAEPEHKRLEIGYTWYAKSCQRSGINTECKYLLLQYAFETLGSIAVEFRTHWHNLASRNAIIRLGAKQDGVLRNHRVDEEERIRDTVVFSIIQNEWKAVKRSLKYQLKKYDK